MKDEILISDGVIKVIEIKKGHTYQAKRRLSNGVYREYVKYNAKDLNDAVNYAIIKAENLGINI